MASQAQYVLDTVKHRKGIDTILTEGGVLLDADIIATEGYDSAVPGRGGNRYRYNTTPFPTIDDGGFYIDLGGNRWLEAVEKGTIDVDVTQFGAKGDGSDDTDAIKAAADAASALAVSVPADQNVIYNKPMLRFPRTDGSGYLITDTITVNNGIDIRTEDRIVAATSMTARPALVVGRSGSTQRNFNANLDLEVVREDFLTTPDLADIGIQLINAYYCNIRLRGTYRFTIGAQCLGTGGQSFLYNQVVLGALRSSHIALDLRAEGTSACNENVFYGGRFNAGIYIGNESFGVRLSNENASISNTDNNYFIKPSFELNPTLGNTSYCFLAENTTGLYVENTRMESNGAGTQKWARFTGNSENNRIILSPGGDNSEPHEDTTVSRNNYVSQRKQLWNELGSVIFESGDLGAKANYYDGATNTFIADCCLATATATEPSKILPDIPFSSAGVSPGPSRGVGRIVDTQVAKQFVIDYDADQVATIWVMCFDAAGDILDPAGQTYASFPGVFASNSLYRNSGTNPASMPITVEDSVKSIAIFVADVSNLRSFAIRCIDRTNQTAKTSVNYDEVMPGLGVAKAVPTGGTYETGKTIFNDQAVVGQSSGWRCTQGGTPGTWETVGDLGDESTVRIFRGSDDLTIGNSLLGASTDFDITVQFYLSSGGSGSRTLFHQWNNTVGSLALMVNASNRVNLLLTGSWSHNGSIAIAEDEKTTVRVTRTGGDTFAIYVNGVADTPPPNSVASIPQIDNGVGGLSPVATDYFIGDIDSVTVINDSVEVYNEDFRTKKLALISQTPPPFNPPNGESVVWQDDAVVKVTSTDLTGNTKTARIVDPTEVTPEQFGAVGDGVADDTAAIQAAIDSGADLKVTQKHVLTSSISLTTDAQRIYGGGTFAETSADLVGMLVANANDVAIEDINFQGRTTEAIWNGGTMPTDPDQYFSAVRINSTQHGLRVKNCQFSGKQTGVRLALGAHYCEITDCKFQGIFTSGAPTGSAARLHNFVSTEATHSIIQDNIAFDVGTLFTAGAGSAGNTIGGNLCYTAYDNGIYCSTSSLDTIDNNVLFDITGSGVKVRGSGYTITANICRSTTIGIGVTPNTGDATTSWTRTHIEFDGGATEPQIGELLTGATSLHSGYVRRIHQTGGSWSTNDATGWIEIEPLDETNPWIDNENIDGNYGGASMMLLKAYSIGGIGNTIADNAISEASQIGIDLNTDENAGVTYWQVGSRITDNTVLESGTSAFRSIRIIGHDTLCHGNTIIGAAADDQRCGIDVLGGINISVTKNLIDVPAVGLIWSFASPGIKIASNDILAPTTIAGASYDCIVEDNDLKGATTFSMAGRFRFIKNRTNYIAMANGTTHPENYRYAEFSHNTVRTQSVAVDWNVSGDGTYDYIDIKDNDIESLSGVTNYGFYWRPSGALTIGDLNLHGNRIVNNSTGSSIAAMRFTATTPAVVNRCSMQRNHISGERYGLMFVVDGSGILQAEGNTLIKRRIGTTTGDVCAAVNGFAAQNWHGTYFGSPVNNGASLSLNPTGPLTFDYCTFERINVWIHTSDVTDIHYGLHNTFLGGAEPDIDSASGYLYRHDLQQFQRSTTTPVDPPNGESVVWQDDDVVKVTTTDLGGNTKTARIVDPYEVIPEDFGAVGDGVADDSDAIQALVDSGNPTVSMKPGSTYLVTKQIDVPGDITIEGNGATILETSQVNRTFFITTGNDNVTIRNLVHQGSLNSGNYTPTGDANTEDAFIRCQGEHCLFEDLQISGKPIGVSFSAGNHCTVRDVQFDGIFPNDPLVSVSSHTGIYVRLSDDVTVENCRGKDAGSIVLAGSTPKRLLVTACRMVNAWDNGIYFSSAAQSTVSDCFIESVSNTSGTGIKCRGDRNKVIGCEVTDAPTGITMSCTANGVPAEGAVVADNICSGGNYGIAFAFQDEGYLFNSTVTGNKCQGQLFEGMRFQGIRDTIVANNVIDAPNASVAGIFIGGLDPGVTADRLCLNNRIQHNIIEGRSTDGNPVNRQAVGLDWCRGTDLIENRLINGTLKENNCEGTRFDGEVSQLVDLTGSGAGTSIPAPAGAELRGLFFDVTQAADQAIDAKFVVGSTTSITTATSGTLGTSDGAYIHEPELLASDAYARFDPNAGSFTTGQVLARIFYRSPATISSVPKNIYAGDGALTEDRTVDLDGFAINFDNGTLAANASGASQVAFTIDTTSLKVTDADVQLSSVSTLVVQDGSIVLTASAGVGGAHIHLNTPADGGVVMPVSSGGGGDVSTPATGMMKFNTTTNKLQVYNGTAWETITSA